jgi:hypothetical protein
MLFIGTILTSMFALNLQRSLSIGKAASGGTRFFAGIMD